MAWEWLNDLLRRFFPSFYETLEEIPSSPISSTTVLIVGAVAIVVILLLVVRWKNQKAGLLK